MMKIFNYVLLLYVTFLVSVQGQTTKIACIADAVTYYFESTSEVTQIYQQSFLPVHPNVGDGFLGHKRNHQKIMETNKQPLILVKVLRAGYIALYQQIKAPDSNLNPAFTHDDLHSSKKGYNQWHTIVYDNLKGPYSNC